MKFHGIVRRSVPTAKSCCSTGLRRLLKWPRCFVVSEFHPNMVPCAPCERKLSGLNPNSWDSQFPTQKKRSQDARCSAVGALGAAFHRKASGRAPCAHGIHIFRNIASLATKSCSSTGLGRLSKWPRRPVVSKFHPDVPPCAPCERPGWPLGNW